MDFAKYREASLNREDSSDGKNSSDGEDSLNVMPDGNMGYLQHMNPPQQKTWSLSVGANMMIYKDGSSSSFCKTPDHQSKLWQMFEKTSLSDEPRSPPSSVTSPPGFPKPTPMTRSRARCHNKTRFDTQDQSPENSSSSVVQKLDFFGSWYET